MSLAQLSFTEIERAVWAKARTGQVADVHVLNPQGVARLSPPQAGGAPRIRAETVTWMLAQPTGSIDLPAIRIRGAEITGNLNLGGRIFTRALELHECYIGGRVSLACAVLPAVSFRGSTLAKGISARRLTVARTVHLGEGFRSAGRVCLNFAEIGALNFVGSYVRPRRGVLAIDGTGISIAGHLTANQAHVWGEVRLVSGHVEGNVDFENAVLANLNPDGTALNAERLSVGGSLRCTGQFSAYGRVQLRDARVGLANFVGARLSNPARVALDADRLTATAGIFCRDGFLAHGGIRLLEAELGTADFDGAHLYNPARIGLNAERARIAVSLFCRDGFIVRGEVRLLGAKIGANASFTDAQLLNLEGDALSADNMSLGGDLLCSKGFVACGAVRLPGAKINGSAYFSGARLVNPKSNALFADNIDVGGDLLCEDGFVARGEVRLLAAKIGADAIFNGARLLNPKGDALSADNIDVGGDLLCEDGFVARGEVRLLAAKIGAGAIFNGARLLNPKGDALSADGMRLSGDMFCRDGFVARGQVRLPGAQVGGNVEFDGARLLNPNGGALNADGMHLAGDMFCRNGFVARGQVNVIGAQIGGDISFYNARLLRPDGDALDATRLGLAGSLRCTGQFTTDGGVELIDATVGLANFSGARLCNPAGVALSADRLTSAGGLICRNKFEVRGKVRLAEAQLRAVDFEDAHLHNPTGEALSAFRLTVTEGLFCRNGFGACGEVDLSGARIGADLDLSRARLLGGAGSVLDLARAQVGGRLRLTDARISPGTIDASWTTVRHLDDLGVTWPPGSMLTGFSYGSLPSGSSERATNRVKWLRATANGRYLPQTYDQLASVYRAAGHSRAARSVMIEKQRDRRHLHDLPLKGWHRVTRQARGALLAAWSGFLRWSIGYGYAPWRALIPFAATWMLAWLIFAQAHPGDITPTATAHDQFHPAVYALDLLLPVVDLRQRASWTPHHGYYWWTLGFTIIGWLIATVIVAGLTDLFKHD